MDTTATIPEAEALESLKAHVADDKYPILSLAREAEHHRQTYPQKLDELAQKMGKSRPWLSQLLGILDLPTDVLEKAETDRLGFRELRDLRAAYRPQISGNAIGNGGNAAENIERSGDNVGNASGNAITLFGNAGNVTKNGQMDERSAPIDGNAAGNARNPIGNGYPLIRDTLNTLVRLTLFWVKEPGLGEIAERWLVRFTETGWLRLALAALALVFAGYGGWSLTQKVSSYGFRVTGWAIFQQSLQPETRNPQPVTGVTAAPQILSHRWVAGHQLELKWSGTGVAGETYTVYAEDLNDHFPRELNERPLKSPGAVVQSRYDLEKSNLFVRAIYPDGKESAASQKFAFEPLPINDRDSARELQQPSLRATSGAKQTTAGNREVAWLPLVARKDSFRDSLMPPTDLHYEVKTPDLIRLTWRAVGKEVRYNVYSSGARELTNLRKENEKPMQMNVVTWTPETGLDRYWVVVTSIGPDGKESTYSEAIEVVRRPEKTGPDAADAAAGVLRKVLSW